MNTNETKYRIYTFEIVDSNKQLRSHSVTADSYEQARDDMFYLLEDGEEINNFIGSEVAPA